MTLGLAFWVLMLLWLVLGVVWRWPAAAPAGQPFWRSFAPFGGDLLLFILLFLLGWKAFGPPIHG